jgi:hypothetical protein
VSGRSFWEINQGKEATVAFEPDTEKQIELQ